MPGLDASSQSVRGSGLSAAGCARLRARAAKRPLVGLIAVAFAVATSAIGQVPLVVHDQVGDVQLRRTDLGADGEIDPNTHRLPDIVSYSIGQWQPDDPYADPFGGQWFAPADFFRLELVFDGLVNPPGTIGCCGYPFDPFLYGPHPVFGYVEIDIDADVDTGGELDWPQVTYLGNAARWGGVPAADRFDGRAALDLFAFDGNTTTPPFVEFSGEDFRFELLGWNIASIDNSIAGDGDLTFEEGETWDLTGDFLPRSRGYERFSFACCTGPQGQYVPETRIRYHHDANVDQTTISLVFPLTNAGSAALRGEEVEDNDGDASNQSSIEEGLDELVFSAVNAPSSWRNDPDFAIIARWEYKTAADYLDPTQWTLTAVTACSYASPEGPDLILAWTDIVANVTPGDFDGDGAIGCTDLQMFDDWLAATDGSLPMDEDGMVNGIVTINNFGPNFSVYDVNYDGVVDAADRPRIAGDLDGDDDVDLADLAGLLANYGSTGGVGPDEGDLDGDDDVDLVDLAALLAAYGVNCP